MRCRHCSSENRDAARYCTTCGAALATTSESAQPFTPSYQSGHTTAPPFDLGGPPAHQAPTDAYGTRAVTQARGQPRPFAQDLRAEFERLPFSVLLPLRAWWEDPEWRQGWIAMFLIAALAPFVLLHLASSDSNSDTMAWGFSLYFALIWLVGIRTLVRPEPVAGSLLLQIALFTIFASVAIAITLEHELATSSPGLIEYIIGVGLPEEFAKALPIFMLVYRRRLGLSTRTYLYLGAVSGLAFGAAEAVSYSTAYSRVAPFLTPSSFVSTEIWRLVTDSLFHACMTGIVAYYIGLAAAYPRLRNALMIFGLAVAAVLHGAYDATANGWGGLAIAAGIVFVFVGYVRTGDQIAGRLATHGN